MLDGFVGAEYAEGLKQLKARVEEDRRPTAHPAIVVPPQAPPAPPAGEAGEAVVKQTPAQGAQPAVPAPAPGAAPAPAGIAPPPPPPRR